MSVLAKRGLLGAAVAAGVLAVAMLIGVLFMRPLVAAWLYSAAFLVGLVGVALAAADNLHERHQRLAVLPRTRLGWWSLALTAGGILLFVVGSLTRSATPDGPGVPMFLISAPAIAALISGGVVAVIAWFRGEERSLLVLLTVLPSLFAVYFVLGELVFPH